MAILFSNSSLKIPKLGIFGPKFKDFYFYTEFCNKDNSRTLISSMSILFSNFSPKILKFDVFGQRHQNKAFSALNLEILFLRKILQLDKFEGANFRYENSFLKFQPENTQIRHFWSKMQAFSLFHEILQLGKSEGADSKYDNIIFKFQPKTTQVRLFWSQIQVFLVLRKVLQLDKFVDADLNYDDSFFKNSRPKIPI